MLDPVGAEAQRLGVGDLFGAMPDQVVRGRGATHKIQARYDAAGTGRRVAHWVAPASGPNTAGSGAAKVRDRTRDVIRNNWSGASASNKWATALIGVGITPRFSRIKSKERRQYVTDLYRRWAKVCDADGVSNYYGQQTLSVKAQFDGGEVFVRRRPRPIDPKRWPVPLQIQLIEADQVPPFDADQWTGMPRGHTIRRGIERNAYGDRVAVWAYREHPGDRPRDLSSLDPSRLVRVLIEDVSHMFEPHRVGQLRGVSEMAAVLMRVRNTDDLEDAVLERQKLANLFAMFVTRPPGDDGTGDVDPLTGKPIEYDNVEAALARLEPGLSMELDPGQDVKFANPPEAGTTYSEYMRTTHMATSAGLDLPYELYAGDIKEVSDRTLRVIINEFRRRAEQRQWQTVIPKFCEVTIGWFADAALLAGLVSKEEADAIRMADWAPHGWAHIHPVQDPQGKILEVDNGLRSRSSVIGERGDDPEAVDEERAADQQRAKDLDLWVDPAAVAAPGDEVDTDGIPPGEYPQPKKATKK